MIKLVKACLCIICLTLAACATQTGLSEEFDRNVKSYNRMLRWQEIENAGATFMEPGQREDFLKQAAALKKRGLSVTDFRILSSRYIPEKKAGDVLAEFDYYILPSNRIKTISYRQNWVYIEESTSWELRSGLPVFE
jgi:hypothetical protein